MLLFLALFGCQGTLPEQAPVIPGAPLAGAAEGFIDLPVGTPLGGYSARAVYLGAISKQDERDSAYTVGFVESTGVHMRPLIKVIWLDNQDEHFVLIKIDAIYTFDGMVDEVREQLEEATGEDLEGKVVITANHTHHAYGPFSDQPHFYLGGDRYNEEIFQRMSGQIADVAFEAWNTREEAAIGIGWEKDWDTEDRIYSDRRGENRDLQIWEDQEGWETGKDPYLGVLRVDRANGEPLAIAHMFGIHGIAVSDGNSMVTGDAGAAIETRVAESFDEPVVVMHLQTGAGDCSPRGDSGERDFARLEVLGERALGPILDLWEQVPTSSEPMRLQTASRHIWQHHDQIRVTRNGTVDWYYPPVGTDPDGDWPDGDEVVWDGDTLLSPLDEFNAPVGAAFCGSEDPILPGDGIGSVAFPYESCVAVDTVIGLIGGIFDIPVDELPLPMNESYKSGTTASRLGPIPMRLPDGSVVEEDLLSGFFPAEVTSMFSEQWRRRADAELGYTMPLIVGYSQDHEGYFLLPEDWLQGGYEPNINLWGPLQGEHVMEGVLAYADDILGADVHKDSDPTGYYEPTRYAQRELPTEVLPDLTPNAGTRLDVPPEYFWTRLGEPELVAPTSIERVTGVIELGWIGGDPMVDSPKVSLQREVDGEWVPATTHAGRPITEALQDILLGHTPEPLKPVEVEQTHTWWAAWQAVGHTDRTSIPTGTYRLHVAGSHWAGGDSSWPWTANSYELTSEPFEVLPATLEIEADVDGVWVNFAAVDRGYRLVDAEEGGSSTGINPVRGEVTVDVDNGLDAVPYTVAIDTVSGGRSWVPVDLTGAFSVTITDAFGNRGTLSF